MTIQLPTILRQTMFEHASASVPDECCGLLGGIMQSSPTSIYRLRNMAKRPRVSYDAAPEDLFAAQRNMRERGESLIGIYHSHPDSSAPRPSETDTRLAYYPSAVYFIIGFGTGGPILKAFKLKDNGAGWNEAAFEVSIFGTYPEPLKVPERI